MGSVIDKNRQPLLAEATSTDWLSENKIIRTEDEDDKDLKTRVWIETKKLWHIVGPAIFSRIATYTMNVITQSFAGHLGEVELAAISISNTVIVGLNFGLLVFRDGECIRNLMRSSFWSKKAPYVRDIHAKIMDHSDPLLFPSAAVLHIRYPNFKSVRSIRRRCRDVRDSGVMVHSAALQLCVSVSDTEVPAEPAKDGDYRLGFTGGAGDPHGDQLVVCVQTEFRDSGSRRSTGHIVVVSVYWVVLLHCMRWMSRNVEVRVANELGAGRGKAAKFATVVSVAQSTMIGLIFCVLIMIYQDKFALIFSSSFDVLKAVKKISYLLAFTILLNSVQPVLSGVAVGSGWQSKVAYINLGSYYLVGVPLGILMGMLLHTGLEGMWAGMIFGGTALQTIILAFITYRCDWEKEAKKARMHVEKWSEPPPVSQS
ncbi:hypothetical protein HAX54_018807 [Datura stramonium]|uniref:Protein DETOXIFICATION n=1 Tax=Datura stramonium TaxID=4076 RepID=A0ABS8UQE8_DATST|nr:hypothetical protein [Datura stramonium]